MNINWHPQYVINDTVSKELDFLISALSERNPFMDVSAFMDWFEARRNAHLFNVEKISLAASFIRIVNYMPCGCDIQKNCTDRLDSWIKKTGGANI